MEVTVQTERWPLAATFETARQVMHDVPVISVVLRDRDGHCGRAEAAGVDYDGETPASMSTLIRSIVERGNETLSFAEITAALPPGGARNAIDCALWDLEAKRSGVSAHARAGVLIPQPLITALTLGLAESSELRRRARAASTHPLIKLKLDANRHLDVVRAVREEAPDARLVVDANQAWSIGLLDRLLPDLDDLGVEMIEQPLPRDHDDDLVGFDSPIVIAADESCTDRASLAALMGRYQAVNIKLDKSGGLTEALALAREARALGLDVMVGNMCGTSLAMAPAFLVASHARWVDLDGPLLLEHDRKPSMAYDNGLVFPPPAALWG